MIGDLAALPGDLRDQVLAAARDARTPGLAVPRPPVMTAVEAFGRAADSLYAVLCALEEEQWLAPALRDLDVQGAVGHLTAVETDMHRALADDDAVAKADHVASTQAVAAAQRGRPARATCRDWRDAVDRTIALADSEPAERRVAIHGLAMRLCDLLVVRAFELWTHENDIRLAVGLPPSVPDDATLCLMTALAIQLLPIGVARVGLSTSPVDLHLVLTGPGGGAWDLTVGATAGQSVATTIVADSVGFCRLVANRVRPDDLEVVVEGADRAYEVLAGAASLALD
ncbi:MAG TPA: maleylpyruvate isomerase N-terminal domain-containing protein [Mycobacteriales bacterium]|nr:maleylpyruvate isomerase N-terminal domain-containing protein [Mycobacteriales bacterium]